MKRIFLLSTGLLLLGSLVFVPSRAVAAKACACSATCGGNSCSCSSQDGKCSCACSAILNRPECSCGQS